METCDIPKDSKTCETKEGKRCKYCEQFCYGMSDYSFRCTKYSTRKHLVPRLNVFKSGHMRLIQCLEENKTTEEDINDKYYF